MPLHELADRIILENNRIRLEYFPSGEFSVISGEKALLERCTFGVVIDGKKKFLANKKKIQRSTSSAKIDKPFKGNMLRVSAEFPIGKVEEIFYLGENTPLFIEENVSFADETSIERFLVLLSRRLLDGQKEGFVYINGWESWSYTAPIPLKRKFKPPNLGIPFFTRIARDTLHYRYDEKASTSHMVSALSSKDTEFVIGFLPNKVQFTTIRVKRNLLEASAWLDGVKKKSVKSKTLTIIPGKWPNAFKEYSSLLTKELKTKRKKSTSGWCSWYYYYRGVSEGAILRDLKYISSMGYPLDYFQVDDGYQKHIGEWLETNERFPHGLKWLAQKIKEYGYKPGLWLAPFLMAERAKAFREHPDWILRRKGKMVRGAFNPYWHKTDGKIYALNVEKEDVLKFIENILQQLVSYGFEYIKADFLYAGAMAGDYSGQKNRAEIYRNAIKRMRDAIGKDALLLGCGAPMEPAMDLFDLMRVGPDVAINWNPKPWERIGAKLFRLPNVPCILNAARNPIHRWWLNDVWINDPDVIVLRKPMTLHEARFLSTIVFLSGGQVFFSEPLSNLTSNRREILWKVLPPSEIAAYPLDYCNELPEKLFLNDGKHLLVALLNWSRKEREMSFELSEIGVDGGFFFEFWNGELFGFHDSISVKVPPHGVKVFHIVPEDEDIVFLGTTVHLSQNIDITTEEDKVIVSGKLKGTHSGDVLIKTKEPLELAEYNAEFATLKSEGNILRIGVRFSDEFSLILKYKT